jgi:hypothetical protein
VLISGAALSSAMLALYSAEWEAASNDMIIELLFGLGFPIGGGGADLCRMESLISALGPGVYMEDSSSPSAWELPMSLQPSAGLSPAS